MRSATYKWHYHSSAWRDESYCHALDRRSTPGRKRGVRARYVLPRGSLQAHKVYGGRDSDENQHCYEMVLGLSTQQQIGIGIGSG